MSGLVVSDLAKVIKDSLGATDSNGAPISVTPQMETYAKAIINTFHAATVSNLPGTINGVTAAGSPLTAGTGLGGTLLNFLPATWLAAQISGFPTSNPAILAKEAAASTGYISGAAKIDFAVGTITGQCTSTAVSPGPLVTGAGSNGTVDLLVGAAWAALVIPPLGNPLLTIKLYTNIVNYIAKNAVASYPVGTVQGTCPPVSGPLTLGFAAGGMVK